MTATDTATEVVAEVAEEVADQAQNLARASRGLSGREFGLAFSAFLIGAGFGGGLAFVLASRRIETKFSRISDEAIMEMREHYHDKVRSLEATTTKGNLEELVTERGYSSSDEESPPMAVAPPKPMVQAAAEAPKEEQAEAKKSEVRNIFANADQKANVTDSWDYDTELRNRSPDAPYIVHVDERHEFDDYQMTTLTLYDLDDVLCNESDEVIAGEERDNLVGESNLLRFGHGSNDPNVVYIRNDKLELLLEVVKSPNSYAEEVHGFRHMDYSNNLERMRARERENTDDE